MIDAAPGKGRYAVLGASALAVAIMAGCGAQVAEAVNIWDVQIREIYESTESDFVRDVLRDGVITTAEVRESRERFLSCAQDAGLPVTLWESGDDWGTAISRELTEAESELEFQCFLQWDGFIQGLYTSIAQNPDGVDRDDLIAACLIRHGLAPEGFTGRDYRELIAPLVMSFTGAETEEEIRAIEDAVANVPQPVLPGGHLLNEGIAWDCQVNPQI